MDTKFINALVLNLLFLSSLNPIVNRWYYVSMLDKDISIFLDSNIDTCYYSNDRIMLSIKLENISSSTLRINKNIPVTTKKILEHDNIRLNIIHNNIAYEYAFLDGKDEMPKECNLFEKKSMIITDIINFKQLVTKTEIEKITNISATKIDNVDFGAYHLQALYVRNSNDTVFSNWLQVQYLK